MTHWPSAPRVDAQAARRARAFDLLRGLCVVSMAFGHIAAGSVLERVTHLFEWVDGAVGFVFISGLVLALVHRQTVDCDGLAAALARVLRRIRLIYLVNVAVTLFALMVGTWLPGRTEMPDAHQYGWSTAVLRVLIVAINPPFSVLGLYVYLMLFALAALTLLARRRTGLLVAVSVVVYVGVRVGHLDTTLPGHGRHVDFHVGGWQLLFVLGMVVGWRWRDLELGRRLLDRRVQIPAGIMVVLLTLLAHLARRGALNAGATTWLFETFDKATLSPGVLLFGVSVLTAGYGVVTWILRSTVGRFFASVEVIGRHGLGSYVIATFAAMAFPAVLRYSETGWLAQALTVMTLAAAYCWARLRERRRPSVPAVVVADSGVVHQRRSSRQMRITAPGRG